MEAVKIGKYKFILNYNFIFTIIKSQNLLLCPSIEAYPKTGVRWAYPKVGEFAKTTKSKLENFPLLLSLAKYKFKIGDKIYTRKTTGR